MAIMPGAIWRPIPSFSAGPISYERFVLHACQGFDPYQSFSNPAFQASSHFYVATDGTIYQYVDTYDAAWAQEAGNYSGISCETEGFGVTDPTLGAVGVATMMPAAQYASVLAVYLWTHETHGIPLQTCNHDGLGITTHCFYPSGAPDPAWGDHSCPGCRLDQLPQLVSDAIAHYNPPAPTPEAPSMTVSCSAHDRQHLFTVQPDGQLVWRGQGTAGWQHQVLATDIVAGTIPTVLEFGEVAAGKPGLYLNVRADKADGSVFSAKVAQGGEWSAEVFAAVPTPAGK